MRRVAVMAAALVVALGVSAVAFAQQVNTYKVAGSVSPAKYVKGNGGGTSLQFDVPANVLHPVPGFTVATRVVQSSIKLKTKKIKGVKHGYYESVNCSGSKRPIKVTFTTEAGQTSTTAA